MVVVLTIPAYNWGDACLFYIYVSHSFRFSCYTYTLPLLKWLNHICTCFFFVESLFHVHIEWKVENEAKANRNDRVFFVLFSTMQLSRCELYIMYMRKSMQNMDFPFDFACFLVNNLALSNTVYIIMGKSVFPLSLDVIWLLIFFLFLWYYRVPERL